LTLWDAHDASEGRIVTQLMSVTKKSFKFKIASDRDVVCLKEDFSLSCCNNIVKEFLNQNKIFESQPLDVAKFGSKYLLFFD
jgi:hypothetical protein